MSEDIFANFLDNNNELKKDNNQNILSEIQNKLISRSDYDLSHQNTFNKSNLNNIEIENSIETNQTSILFFCI